MVALCKNCILLLPLRLIGASLIALSATTACSVTGKGSFCAIAKPIRLSDQAIDAMSDAEVKAALATNRQGAALCGWKK